METEQLQVRVEELREGVMEDGVLEGLYWDRSRSRQRRPMLEELSGPCELSEW